MNHLHRLHPLPMIAHVVAIDTRRARTSDFIDLAVGLVAGEGQHVYVSFAFDAVCHHERMSRFALRGEANVATR